MQIYYRRMQDNNQTSYLQSNEFLERNGIKCDQKYIYFKPKMYSV